MRLRLIVVCQCIARLACHHFSLITRGRIILSFSTITPPEPPQTCHKIAAKITDEAERSNGQGPAPQTTDHRPQELTWHPSTKGAGISSKSRELTRVEQQICLSKSRTNISPVCWECVFGANPQPEGNQNHAK